MPRKAGTAGACLQARSEAPFKLRPLHSKGFCICSSPSFLSLSAWPRLSTQILLPRSSSPPAPWPVCSLGPPPCLKMVSPKPLRLLPRRPAPSLPAFGLRVLRCLRPRHFLAESSVPSARTLVPSPPPRAEDPASSQPRSRPPPLVLTRIGQRRRTASSSLYAPPRPAGPLPPLPS